MSCISGPNRVSIVRSVWAFASLLLLWLCSVVPNALAADWPQYRFDAQRSGASPEALPEKLQLQWVRELPPPQPAFPDEPRLRYDGSYEPVVSDGTMFVPSMVADSITALDAETGEQLWVFFTDGPVRFAPVAGDGKVHAISDDGYLYCLDADTGELLWKFRGLPEDGSERKLLGHQRLISLHPARGGPVLENGVVYFAAGIWPQDGVFIHAVDAETGEAVWSNTTGDKIENANMDHGVSQYAGLTPQGYLARVHDKLVLPCGTQLPALLSPETGELDRYTMGWGGRVGLPKGSWFAAGAGKYLSHSGDLYDITRPNDEEGYREKRMLYPGVRTRLKIDPANQRTLGNFNKFETRRDPEFLEAADARALADFRRPVLTEQAMYFNDREQGTGITAYDLTNVELKERSEFEPTIYRTQDKYPDKWKGAFKRLWSLSSEANVFIKAGNRLYVGREGIVQAIDIPASGSQQEGEDRAEPAVSWTSDIEGTPHTMLAATGKLFVVTDAGRLYAFGGEPSREVVRHERPEPTGTRSAEASGTAKEIVKAVDVHEGYALVLGLDGGELVEDLLARSQLRVIAVDPDAEQVEQLRRRLYRAGLYGVRATAHVGDPLSYPLPPFMADLITSEAPDKLTSGWSSSAARALFHPLRPYGGAAVLPGGGGDAESVIESLQAAKLAGAAVDRSGEFVLLTREGPLPGSASWSHAEADAANSGASQDGFLKPPLHLLWFDPSFRWHRKPGGAQVRVGGSRVFVKAEKLHAVDAYTGRPLWTVDILDSLPDDTLQMVAVEDGLYLAGGDGPCLVLDPATGRQAEQIELPDEIDGGWTNLRVRNEWLVATAGKHLLCFQRDTGQLAWRFACDRAQLSTAVGRGKVFCCELLNRRREGSAEEAGTRLRAFDMDSGELLWEITCGEQIRYAGDLDWLVTQHGVFDAHNGNRLRDSADSPRIAGTQLISGSTDEFTIFDLAAEEQQERELEWSRRGCTDLRASPHLVTTRYKANAAYIDLSTLQITPLWNIRPGCGPANNLFPAEGLLNVPNVTGGCECNYTPVSKAFAPEEVIRSVKAGN